MRKALFGIGLVIVIGTVGGIEIGTMAFGLGIVLGLIGAGMMALSVM